MKSIKVTSEHDLLKTISYIKENCRGCEDEVKNDLENAVISFENNGIEFEFTSIDDFLKAESK